MELSKSVQIGIAISVIGIGSYVAYKAFKKGKKVKDDSKPMGTDTPKIDTKPFDIKTFVLGDWSLKGTNPDKSTFAESFTWKDGQMIYGGVPTANITNLSYDDATGHISFTPTYIAGVQKGKSWNIEGTVDKEAKTITSKYPDGTISLLYTKK